MNAPHNWRSNGSIYSCRACGAPYVGLQDGCAATLGDLPDRLDALLASAKALSVDLRATRDAAASWDKAGLRLANVRVEKAIAKLADAARALSL